jgi:serine/threonine-protein kinase
VNPGYTYASGAGSFAGGVGGNALKFKRIAIATSLVAAGLLIAVLWGWLRPVRESPGMVVRFRVTGGSDFRLTPARPAFSPDGRILVFRGIRGGTAMLLWRALDDSVIHVIPGTENASTAFFSPDGKWIGFFAGAGVQKVQLTGGAPTMVSNVQQIRGAAWTIRNVILIGMQSQLLAVPAAGGTARPVAPLDTARGEASQRFPLPLADGETVLYTSSLGGGAGGYATGSQIGVMSLSKGTTRLLDVPGTLALAVMGDHLIYLNVAGTLMAVPFDSSRARVTGSPVPVGD